MKCPFCSHPDTHVKDTRASDDHTVIKRRRHCPNCDSRFTTQERVQLRELFVIKRNGARELFNREKIARSLHIALRKRPVSEAVTEQAIDNIVTQLERRGDADIPCDIIGEMVMDTLQQLDQVGYIRYASVYRDFREAGDFEKFMEDMAGQ